MREKIETDNTFIKAGLIILLFISFFIGFQEKYSFVKNAYLILQIIAVLCIMISEKKIRIDTKTIPMVALICIIIIICNRNARLLHGSFALDSRICTAFLVYFLIYRKTSWYNTLIKSLIILGIFYGFTTIYLYIYPQAYFRYVVPLFGTKMEDLYQKGYAVGFSRHFSTTAIYHSVTLGIPVCVFVRKNNIGNKQKVLFAFLSVILYIGVLLTTKRAHSIFIPISAVFCYYAFSKEKSIGTKAKIVGGILLFLVVIYISIQIVPSLNNILIRFERKIESGDVTSGRTDILQECKTLFIYNPIIGSGWGSFTYYTAYGVQNAHNVYAQLVAENGVLLSIPFYVFIFGSIWHTIKAAHIAAKGIKQLSSSFQICLVYSLYIQIFFVLYCFTGNPLYDFQFVLPYMLGCAIGENAYRICVVTDRTIANTTPWKTIRQDLDEMIL